MRLARPSLVAARWILAAAIAADAVAAAFALGASPLPGGTIAATGSVEAYRGMGTWVDIYDPAWSDPAAAVADMKARGVRTLYLQTSNFSRPSAFVHPDGVMAFLDAAHAAGIRVVGWYLPGLRDVGLDLGRSLAAVRLRTPEGNGFDSFALDIESTQVADPTTRSSRLLDLSRELRSAVGADYPLGAIIPSPRALQRSRTYWPDFPYRSLATSYDVFLPMTYFTWRVSGEAGAHAYTATAIDLIRRDVGERSIPIHVIGGIAGDAPASETRGFVHAVRERGVLGASFYTYSRTTDGEWRELSKVPPNPVEVPALPLPIGSAAAVGDIPHGDSTHPDEVVYRAGALAGDQRLTYRAFDVQRGEVSIYVNWTKLANVAPTATGAWGGTQSRVVPASLLDAEGPNYIIFVADGAAPGRSVWGVRDATMAGPPALVSPSNATSTSSSGTSSPTPAQSPTG